MKRGYWAEYTMPTQGELFLALAGADPEELWEFAGRAIENAERASACFIENHVGRLRRDEPAGVVGDAHD